MTEHKKEAMLKLIDYLLDVDESEDYCVFIDLSGHVEKLDVRLVKSRDAYMVEIARDSFYYSDSHEDGEFCDEVDEAIQQIGKMRKDRTRKIAEANEALKKQRRDEYLRLKKEFEGDDLKLVTKQLDD